MNNQSRMNKQAWEYRAYDFWVKRDGPPEEKAKQLMKDPKASLKKHQHYFDQVKGKTIANICGSNGRRAVPLSLLGAEVTVFDLSEENKRYALELANCAGTSIEYEVTDIYELDIKKYLNHFDLLYLEGGVLHYFDDLHRLFNILFAILKQDGQMVLSDYHPIKRCIGPDLTFQPNYFDQEPYTEDIAYKQYFDEEEQPDFPNVLLNAYTLSDIINSLINSGFTLQHFDEHRGWNGENIPWEFTMVATK